MTEAEQVKMLKKHSKALGKRLEEAQAHLRSEVAGHMHLILPEEKRGIAQIIHKKVEAQDVALENLRCAINGRPDMVTPPGTYAVLHTKETKEDEHWTLMMSDTPYEMRAARGLKLGSHGKVLIAGLGLGATTLPVLQRDVVESVTVIETNPDVVDIVGPKLKATEWGKKLDIVLDNAFTWRAPKGVKFNTIWLDIWPSICADNLPDMRKLKRKYARYLDRSDDRSWIGVWEEAHLRREARRYGML
jgi:hypothetical protein